MINRPARDTKSKNMAKIKGNIPENSLLKNHLPADYVDVYKCNVADKSNLTPDDILIHIWTVQPGWVDFLFRLRNILVKPFGLETGNNDKFKDRKSVV
jgi:hypothetical protein